LHDAERRLLGELATTVEEAVAMLSRSIDPGPGWALARGAQVHRRLAELASARATARANVRIAPRRWHLRPVVEPELARLSRFDVLAEAVLGTARAAIRPIEGSPLLPKTLRDELATIGAGLRQLAATKQPWPTATLDDVRATAGRIVARATSDRVDRAAVVNSLLHLSALDLAAILGDEQALRGRPPNERAERRVL
jgi:hypothetical protein